MLGDCSRTVGFNSAYSLVSTVVTYQLGVSLTWPDNLMDPGTAGYCDGTVELEYSTSLSAAWLSWGGTSGFVNAPITGNVLAPATNILSIDDASSTDGTTLTVVINVQWTIGVISPETITGTQSFTLTTYSLWKEAELELNLTLQEVSDTVVFDVQQIASTDTTQETKELEYAWYSREYFFKQAQVAFEPVPFAAANGELTQTSDYLTGDEYPIEREEGVSYWGSSNDWSTNPAQFICSLWTIENERTTEDFNVAI